MFINLLSISLHNRHAC